MDATYQKQLERNIGKYSWYKIFTKRVYLPLITIQLVNVGNVSVEQIAAIAAVSVIISLLLQLPTGYFADRYGNRLSILVGCLIALPSPLFYAWMPNFTGGMIASILFFGGYAFQSGAIEAFMHDTLAALKREDQYTKIMGRAQSYGLIGNVILLVLIPATYSLNHALPFVLGFLSLVAMLALALSFTYPPRSKELTIKNPFLATRSIVNKENLALFVFAGVALGTSYSAGNYRELVWQDVGISVGLFGILVAIASLVGAVLGRYLYVVEKLKPLTFYMLDVFYIAGFLILAGSTTNKVVVIVAFTMLAAYDRVHGILFQSKLLQDIRHAYKATLLSSLNLFTTIAQAGAAALLGKLVGLRGFQNGHVAFGLAFLAIGLLLWLMVSSTTKQRELLDPDHF